LETLKPVLTPRELAEAVGVSESSIKRWADDGTVKAVRTAGGHRRILIEEAVRFLRTSDLALIRPEILGLPETAAAGAVPVAGEEGEQLYGHLRNGSSAHTRGLIFSLYMSGRSVASIIDHALRPAMERIGEEWLHHAPGVFWEHRATDLAIQALHQLRTLLPGPRKGAPVALGGAPSGDPYILPSLAVSAVLLSLGFSATNLGPETPVSTLWEATESLDPRIVWLSVSALERPAALRGEVRDLVAGLESRRASLLVGGRARLALGLAPHQNLHVGSSMAELEAYAKGLVASEA